MCLEKQTQLFLHRISVFSLSCSKSIIFYNISKTGQKMEINCPSPSRRILDANINNINISPNQKNTRMREYCLTNHCNGPFGTSPPSSWCQRLQSRFDKY